MPFDLAAGVTVRVEHPGPPQVRVTPPSSTVLVVPVQGPPGPAGSPGTGVGGPRSFRHTQTSPAVLVQVVHGLDFRPAGVLCVDTLDSLTEPDRITSPAPGITEITFGAPFSGVIDLS